MEYLVQGNLPLTRGSMVRVEDGRGMLVYVWSGNVWVTQEGDRHDRHVAAGGWCRITSAGLTLVSALGRSAIALTSPHEEGFAVRIDLVRAGTGQVVPIFVMPGKLEALRARVAKTWNGWFAPQARATTAGL